MPFNVLAPQELNPFVGSRLMLEELRTMFEFSASDLNQAKLAALDAKHSSVQRRKNQMGFNN